MRNKGFFWFLTVLLTVICIYQLSFTWVSSNVEKEAAIEADTRVEALKLKSEDNNMIAYLPNNKEINFNDAEAEELAKAAFINQILKEKAETPVHPLFGSTFKSVKQRSLAFGLDLVGGMSVTLEISIPELVENYARNPREISFKNPYESAKQIYGADGGDFVDLFLQEYKKENKGKQLVKVFAFADIDELNKDSSDEDVVDFLKAKQANSMGGVEEIMNRRINQFGVAQPNIQKDPANNRLYIELPGVQDESTVADKLVATANLEFYETFDINEIYPAWQAADQISRTDGDSDDVVEEEVLETVDSEETVIAEELVSTEDEVEEVLEEEISFDEDELVNADESLDFNAGDSVIGLSDVIQVTGSYAIGLCSMENKSKADEILRREDVMSVFDNSLVFMWSADAEEINTETKEMGYVLYAIRVPNDGKAPVGGKDIKNASTGYNTEDRKVTVDLEMSIEGGEKWAQMTEANVGKIVAITMDNVVFSAPRVNGAIVGGRTEITGNFTIQEANDLSGLLNGGALPAPLVIKEQTRVGPTIGAENSRAGLMSFGVALLLVFIYMIFYYGKAGIVADIALFANILFIFGSLASFGAVLTLAGIAGIVLTIGMAVDANVLIFERIREEQASGKDLKTSIDTGFKKALSSIMDANITTMLTAIVLKSFGSGPIESFATTLIIGIFTSVFAALVITRLSINWWMKKGRSINFESKFTKNAFKNFKFDFIGNRKKFYVVSSILVIGSIAALMTRQLNPSVEFSGGRSYSVKFDKSVENERETVRGALENVFVEDGKVASIILKTKSSNFNLDITTNFLMGDENANNRVTDKLKEGLTAIESKIGGFTIQESRSVSSTVSNELISSSMTAIILSLIIIFAYILIRFGRWQYSTGAIIAMMHDVLIVLGIFALFHGIMPFNMDIDQAFVAAILTVIGYSINDTVIVFDRIRENLGLHKHSDEKEQINRSLNSTLSRTINTSMTTFIVLLIVFVFGGGAIKGFIFALMIGVVVGTYSSVCIATPILVDFSKKKKKETAEIEPAKA